MIKWVLFMHMVAGYGHGVVVGRYETKAQCQKGQIEFLINMKKEMKRKGETESLLDHVVCNRYTPPTTHER